MKSLMRFFLGLFVVLFIVSCEDVNTLCANDGNETNSTDCNCTTTDDNTTTDTNDTTRATDDTVITYRYHYDIKSDLFWIGESDHNSSAWDSDWIGSYGGEDSNDSRDGYYPSGFTPNENPFYVALPYNDLNSVGITKTTASSVVPWASSSDSAGISICKNRWIKITANGKIAYAQWEDVGLYGSDDSDYLFGSAKPSDNTKAGISISPAVRDYLSLDENGSVDWVFVDLDSVPDGPWMDIITTSHQQ